MKTTTKGTTMTDTRRIESRERVDLSSIRLVDAAEARPGWHYTTSSYGIDGWSLTPIADVTDATTDPDYPMVTITTTGGDVNMLNARYRVLTAPPRV